MSEPTTAIPKGSWVLVTGATGFIATHITQELLNRGYRVRGTVRDLSQASWLIDELFSSQHASHDFELVSVADMAAPNAFDGAIKGMSAVIHVATIQSFDPDPKNVIDPTVQGLRSLLDAANNESSVRRFVFTSSVGAAIMLAPGVTGHVGRDTWNEVAVKLALAPPPYEKMRGPMNYMASKVVAEKALWSFVDAAKPGFSVSVVSPTTAIGTILNRKHLKASPGWVAQLWEGETSKVAAIRASIYVNVRDVAVLHVAALLDPEVNGERIQAWAVPFNWNDVLAIMRREFPDNEFHEDLPDMGKITATTDDALAKHLLKKWAGREDWISLDEGVRDVVDSASKVQ